ncbi:MAG: GTP cyclohydrolase [Rhizobiales bacterium 12-68-15]|nr:MAG: GTP cyclohydrolase [Rhizobiales bacterium 12-68-15]
MPPASAQPEQSDRPTAQERAGQVAVERALSELRSGRAVLVEAGGEQALVLGAEALDPESAAQLACASPLTARLALPLAMQVDARIDAPVAPATALDEAALELLRLALVLPAAVIAPVAPGAAHADALRVAEADILAYRAREVRALRMVGRAPVPLEDAPRTEFVVFRGGEGLRDQVAIIVGTPDLSAPVPVRLHSACLTGDLFGSLKCDCGDQLRGTVARMAEGGGGILLYLDQEGRGNGIANKMKAYKLQSEGYDTYDADEVLGFGLDQRRFDFAARMLALLGVRQVELHTNNPEKIGAMKAAGIEVTGEARVIGRLNPENVRYLASKRDRAQHRIDIGG